MYLKTCVKEINQTSFPSDNRPFSIPATSRRLGVGTRQKPPPLPLPPSFPSLPDSARDVVWRAPASSSSFPSRSASASLRKGGRRGEKGRWHRDGRRVSASSSSYNAAGVEGDFTLLTVLLKGSLAPSNLFFQVLQQAPESLFL